MDKDSELWVIFQSIFIVLCYVNITIRYQERNVHAWAHTHTLTVVLKLWGGAVQWFSNLSLPEATYRAC